MVRTNKKIPKVSPKVIHLNQLSCPDCEEIVAEQEGEFVKEDRFKCEECGLVIKPNTKKYYPRRRVAWKENELSALILKTIREEGPMNIREISRKLKCTRSYVSNSTKELISQGMLEERGRWKLYLRED